MTSESTSSDRSQVLDLVFTIARRHFDRLDTLQIHSTWLAKILEARRGSADQPWTGDRVDAALALLSQAAELEPAMLEMHETLRCAEHPNGPALADLAGGASPPEELSCDEHGGHWVDTSDPSALLRERWFRPTAVMAERTRPATRTYAHTDGLTYWLHPLGELRATPTEWPGAGSIRAADFTEPLTPDEQATIRDGLGAPGMGQIASCPPRGPKRSGP